MSSVPQASPSDFPHREDLNKHLEFIQAIISRQANNSFLLKGWSVTLVAALFALAAKDANSRFVWVALVPVFIFDGLDAYYLHQEKQFRSLFDFVRKASSVEIEHMGPFCLSWRSAPSREALCCERLASPLFPDDLAVLSRTFSCCLERHAIDIFLFTSATKHIRPTHRVGQCWFYAEMKAEQPTLRTAAPSGFLPSRKFTFA